MLPIEFLALSDDEEEVVLSDQVAQLTPDPMMAVFEKPTNDERQHLKALFVKDRVDGQPISKILIDRGAVINIMSYVMYQKLGKGDQDLTKTDMMLKDFEGNVSPAKGAVCVELTIDSKTLPTTFFVINGKGAYNLLLGRDWIDANCCVPSTMHQCLVQWIGDKIEVVPGDSSYIIASAESDTYERTLQEKPPFSNGYMATQAASHRQNHILMSEHYKRNPHLATDIWQHKQHPLL
jgi:hypothetical protein